MTGRTETKLIPSSIFDLQRWEPSDERRNSNPGRKRDASFFLNLPVLDVDGDQEKPTESIRKALSVLASAQNPFQSTDANHKDRKEIAAKNASDASSVSTASTTSMRDEEIDLESDHDNEVPITIFPPDALFIVQGTEYPCHAELLSKEARPLLDILSRHGVLERKTKKQRTTSPLRDGEEGEERPQAWSSSSGIMVVRLPNDVDSDFFEVLMEYLYTREISLKLPEGYHEDAEEDDPWLMNEEDILCDTEEEVDDVAHLIDLPALSNERPTTSAAPLKFLQGSYALADRFGCTSVKKAIEHKLYDEFLFSCNAKELFAWADENKCAYLKQKAKDKIESVRD
jgi:hypothetical protein